MTICFIDTETCGLDPIDSAPVEAAFLIYRGSELIAEKIFHLNPLDEEVIFHEEAYKVNGISEEQIRSFPPAAEVIPQMVDFLKPYCPPEKFAFGGYNCKFDYGHIGGIMFRHGFCIGDLFNGKLVDVYELVKKAASMGLLPKTPNQKLETMCKSLGIPHENTHSAMADIVMTRKLYEAIYRLYRGKK